MELTTWRRVEAVNVESALLLAQAFVPGMAARGFGRIIFVVSDTIWVPPRGDMLPYVTSKGALVALARTLAVGHGADGIAVMVAPGLTATPAARRGMPPVAFDDVRGRQARPRTLAPGTWHARCASWPPTAPPPSPARPVRQRRLGLAISRCWASAHCLSPPSRYEQNTPSGSQVARTSPSRR